jgi:putative ABC transport system permease protein
VSRVIGAKEGHVRFRVSALTSWLDLKLGFRMLVRYPVLTIVGGLAMAFAIAAGATTFEVIKRATAPDLPLPDGERIVGISHWNQAEYTQKIPTSYDFLGWRKELRSVQEIGAFRPIQRNLIVGGEVGEPVNVAEISPSAFKVARVPPLLGRTLIEADEDPAAPAVVVLGHRLWQTRFGGDPAVVGRVVRLGEVRATVVGVMPEGFGFPVFHNIWTPLRSGELSQQPGQGSMKVFGRLAPGVTMPQAQAEVATILARVAAQYPKEYKDLSAQVLPYAESILWIPPDDLLRGGIYSVNVFAALFLSLCCANVALLMFARAATRESEILVRGALGASRGRIVLQLFAEALVLGALAAVIGLTATSLALKWVMAALSSELDAWPFWLEGGLSPTTLTYAILLTFLAAAIAGVLPALKVTKRGLAGRLQQASAGAGGLRMGGIWTGVIVAQIAGTVLFTAVAYIAVRQASVIAATKTGFPAHEFLAVRLDMDGETPVSEESNAGADAARTSPAGSPADQRFAQQYATIVRELERRLLAEPAVVNVTVAEQLPLMPQGGHRIEVDESGDGQQSSSRARHSVAAANVDVDFFDVLKAPVTSGRGFDSRDLEPGSNTVIVNHLFVERILAGRSAVGRRIRYAVDARTQAEPAPWLEIVGVSPDLVLDINAPLKLDNPSKPQIYRPLNLDGAQIAPVVYLAAHVRGEPVSLSPRLRQIGADVNASLRLNEIQQLDQATGGDAQAWRIFAGVILVGSATALFLSLAGIYAVMSFTVSRRTREIAVRVALGARATRVVADVFRRPLTNVAVGVIIGWVIVGGLVARSVTSSGGSIGAMMRPAALLLALGLVMIGVCALACIGPILRALRLQPTEALRDVG